jgi:hypothetical protein
MSSLLQPMDIGIILSYRCQCACAHCLYNCGPGWQGWMSFEAVREAVRAAASTSLPRQVHITGGEPFLNFNLLKMAVQEASMAGLPCYVETNAAWCTHEDLVRRQFLALQKEGLQAVQISCSPFHAQTVPLKRTLLAIRVGIEVFGLERTLVYLPEWVERIKPFGIEQGIALDRYIQVYGTEGAGTLFWEGYGLIPGGRCGYRLGHLAPRLPALSFKGMSCRGELLYAPHSHFDLYGNYIPSFCGGISIGSWRDLSSLQASYQSEHYPLVIGILVADGPFGLFEYTRQAYNYLPLAAGYTGKCHLCVDVRRHIVEKGPLPELVPADFYQLGS